MAGATLNLPSLQALIALGGYGGRGNLTPSSAVLGLSAALFLSDLSIWQGAGDTLTDDEIDDIDEIIAQLECDLMLADDMYPRERVKLWNDAGQIIPHATAVNIPFNTEVYDPEEMHSLISNTDLIIPKTAGLHLIMAAVSFDANPIGYRKVTLLRNDQSTSTLIKLAEGFDGNPSTPQRSVLSIACQDIAEVGDWYRLQVFQTSGGNLNLRTEQFSPRFEVLRL